MINSHRSINITGLVFFAGFLVYWIVRSVSYAPHDFSNSYFSAYFLLDGSFDLGIFDPYTFNRRIYDKGFHNIFASYNPNPPSAALFFLPFALFSLSTAKLLFNFMSSLLFVFSLYRLCRHFHIEYGKVFIAIPVIFFIPIRNQILFGQTYFLLFFLISEGYLAYVNQRNLITALLWSCAIMIKIFPAVVFLLLIINKEWKQALMLGGLCVVITLICVLLQGFPIWHHYLTHVLPRSSQGELHSAYTTGTQSIHMMFKYWFQYDPVFNPTPPVNSSIIFYSAQGIWSALVISIAIKVSRLPDKLLALGFLLLCAQLVSPQGSSYSNVLLIIVLAGLYLEQERRIFWVALVLTLLISNIPIDLFHHSPITLLHFPRSVLLVLLFLILLWHFRIIPGIRVLLLLSVFLCGLKLWQHSREMDPSERWIDTEFNSLIVEYQINEGKLSFDYWTENGLRTDVTNHVISETSNHDVAIADNQIFYRGKQLTKTTDNKRKASIINGKEIIYLSDKGKGIGFYAIRRIKIP